jgi:hypothetical protein
MTAAQARNGLARPRRSSSEKTVRRILSYIRLWHEKGSAPATPPQIVPLKASGYTWLRQTLEADLELWKFVEQHIR